MSNLSDASDSSSDDEEVKGTLWYGYNGSGQGEEFYVYDVYPTPQWDLPKRVCISK